MAYEICNDPNGIARYHPAPDPPVYVRSFEGRISAGSLPLIRRYCRWRVLGSGKSWGSGMIDPVTFSHLDVRAARRQPFFDALSYHQYSYTMKAFAGMPGRILRWTNWSGCAGDVGGATRTGRRFAFEYGAPTNRVNEATRAALIRGQRISTRGNSHAVR